MSRLTKLISLAALLVAPSMATAAEVNVVSWGGAYTESQKLGYGDPYQEKSGVQVNWIDYSGGLSEIRTQVESGAITWDIIDVYARDTIIGCDEGLFVEFDFDNDFPAGVNGMKASDDFFAPMPVTVLWVTFFTHGTMPTTLITLILMEVILQRWKISSTQINIQV